ncbi:HNH endonuclease signature motif containing protein [Arthrobacter sp. NPDC056886]|uniref:HNH endonuclease signature motif containing protein n=1 Tax=Arthrobacter sp. NPDC056886 TaxID=3345960 RepID=UPI00366D57F2
MEAGFRRRCSRPAEHGDHFYPWFKGGSTSLQNFVVACSRCNRAKGAQNPSPGQQERLVQRRRTYVTLQEHLYVPSPSPSQMSGSGGSGGPHRNFREPFMNMKGAIATRRLQVTTAGHAFVTLNSEA